MKPLKLVKFLVHYSPYVKGDIAGFKDVYAAKLVEAGKAEIYVVPKKVVLEPEPANEEVSDVKITKKK